MRRALRWATAAVAGYGIGMAPTAEGAARVAGSNRDALDRDGTGNPGGLNVAHVLGRRWGAAVSALDVAKGATAAAVGRRLAGERGANLAATAAVVGHCHPLGRSGGKGVATSIGQVIGTFPAYLPIDVGVGLAVAALPGSRRPTEAATTVASITWIGCALAWWRRGWSCGRRRPTTVAVPIAAAVSSMVIHARFRAEAHRVDAYNARTGAHA